MRAVFAAVVPPVQSNIDPLTGLGDRRLFESRLEMARARMRRRFRAYAVLLVDIDGFRRINDAAGSEAGDAMLRQFAQRLQAACRAGDTIARLKADHFAILLEDLRDVSDAGVVGEAIIDLLARPFEVQGRVIRLQASIGIASCAAGQEIAGKALIGQADAAMHDAKLTLGSCCRSFAGLLRHLAAASAAMAD